MSTLTIMIVAVFIFGYTCIALESVTRVNKAAVALIMCVICWTLLMTGLNSYYPSVETSGLVDHVSKVIESHLGDAAGTLAEYFPVGNGLLIVRLDQPFLVENDIGADIMRIIQGPMVRNDADNQIAAAHGFCCSY